MIARVVLDTNVVVSALIKPHGLEDQVLRLALSGRIQLCISPAVLAEYARVLQYPKLKLKAEEQRVALEELTKHSRVVHPASTIDVITRDAADNRFLECAEEAKADYLVTGNLKHFPVAWKATRVVNGRQLLERLALLDF